MALRTGIPQRVLAMRFTTCELAELFAVRKMDFDAQSKEDVRFQMLAYHVVHAVRASAGGRKGVQGIKPDMFALKWGEAKKVKPKNKAELERDIRALFNIFSRKK